jgi:serine/threonine protein kinase
MDGQPEHIGRYRIVKQLGSGAMGKVYLAHDPALDRTVALKVVSIDRHMQTESRDGCLARFAAEARASARLNHPSIVPVYDTGQEAGEPWIAFQLVEGESLEALLKRRGKLTVRRVILFTIDIASALQHAHAWQIYHRDVKPGNILIDKSTGIARLADFGIVQAPWTPPDGEGLMVGSPGYMSPEQIEGKEVDGRADLFALGAMAYQMISGENPFQRRTLRLTIEATLKGEYTPLRELVPDVPKPLDMAIHRCLYADLRLRIGSAAELVDLLQPIVPPEAESGSGQAMLPKTHMIVESRALAGSSPSAATPLARLFFILGIGRWYVAVEKLARRFFAQIAPQPESYEGEALENFSESLQSATRIGTAIFSPTQIRRLIRRIIHGTEANHVTKK